MEKVPQLLVCAESGVEIGTGHVMRCLALSQSWVRRGGKVKFFLSEGLPSIEERIEAQGISVQRLSKAGERFPQALLRLASREGSSIVMLDGYNFGEKDHQFLNDAGLHVLAVDDFAHSPNYFVSWILNQNIYAAAEMYQQVAPKTKLLLGTSYIVLRDEFLPWISWNRKSSPVTRNVLITLGGSDPSNASERILDALSLMAPNTQDLNITLVVGAANPHWLALQSAVKRSRLRVRVLRDVQDIPKLMAWADVAIACAGTTAYELCFMGVPSILFVAADNQVGIAEHLSKLGVAVTGGPCSEIDAARFSSQFRALTESARGRKAMSCEARKLVDGLGSARVRGELLDRALRLRFAVDSDCSHLFQWANDPDTRAASFRPSAIAWDEHVRWFTRNLQDPDSIVYVGENEAGDSVGAVRFKIAGEKAVLSVSVAPTCRGQGWGQELILFSTHLLARSCRVQRIEALVKPNNLPSVRLFEASNFLQTGRAQTNGQEALLFTWECWKETNE